MLYSWGKRCKCVLTWVSLAAALLTGGPFPNFIQDIVSWLYMEVLTAGSGATSGNRQQMVRPPAIQNLIVQAI